LVGLATGKPNDRVTANLLKLAPKALRLDAAPVRGRALKGVEVVELKPGDEVLNLTIPIEYPRPVKKVVAEEKPKRAPTPPEKKTETPKAKTSISSKGKTTGKTTAKKSSPVKKSTGKIPASKTPARKTSTKKNPI